MPRKRSGAGSRSALWSEASGSSTAKPAPLFQSKWYHSSRPPP